MMRQLIARPRLLVTVAFLGFCAAIGGLAARTATAPQPPPHATPHKAPPVRDGAYPAPGPGWKEVQRLIDEQKMQAALDAASKLRAAAEQKGDGPEWARGLIREVQLRMALH